MGYTPQITLSSLAKRCLIVAALFAALCSRTYAIQGLVPANLPQLQLDSYSAQGPIAGQRLPGNSQRAKPETTLDNLKEILRYGASNITAQAERMQSGVANATASWLRDLVGSTDNDNRQDQVEPFSAVTMDDAQRCAACSPETQLVCCRRRATYVNACKASTCSGELPTSCTPGACKPLEDLAQISSLVSVFGLPAPMPAVREHMGSGPVSGGGNGNAAVAVTKTPAAAGAAVQAFDGTPGSSEDSVAVGMGKQPQQGGADRAAGDENGTPPAGSKRGASPLGPAATQPKQQTITESTLKPPSAAREPALPPPAVSAMPVVPMASKTASAPRQAPAPQLLPPPSFLPAVQEPLETSPPGAADAVASKSIRPLAVSLPAPGTSRPAAESRPSPPGSQPASPDSTTADLGIGKVAAPVTVQAPLPTLRTPTEAALAASAVVAAAMAMAASAAAKGNLTTASKTPATAETIAMQLQPDPPAWVPQSCDCLLVWEPICCGGRTYMNRCTAVCVGGLVDTGHCSPVLPGEQCMPVAAGATEPALQQEEPQAAIAAQQEMQTTKMQQPQGEVQALQTAQRVKQAQPMQGHLAAGLAANLPMVQQQRQQAP